MRVVVRHQGEWLFFSHPQKILQTKNLSEVLPLLREAETSGKFVAGFLAYEAAPAFDPALQTHPPSETFPLLCLGLFDAPKIKKSLATPPASFTLDPLIASVSKKVFHDKISHIKSKIAEGATYQVNYTYRLNSTFDGDAWAFFCQLVDGQHAEHAAFLETEDFALCSASPELFFERSGKHMLARPMKGTAPRGRTLSEDLALAEQLRHSEKDRAENIMIVDMIRNDLGRVARSGSVKVPTRFEIEKYPTVWQMTSTVEAETSAGITEIFKALFPCASITGAPKTKTMEIIRDLEECPRNIYTGTIGFFSPQGDASFNVAIRTALINRRTHTLEYGVGGGVVWDSQADLEYIETQLKARILTQPHPSFQLLETILKESDGSLFLLEEHLQRLANSARYFDIPIDLPSIRQILEQTQAETACRLRLLLNRSGKFSIELHPLPKTSSQPVRLCPASRPIDSKNLFLYHKTTHRSVYETATPQLPNADEILLWNHRKEITETSIANIVIRKQGRLLTPPVSSGLLPGTFRAHLLKNGTLQEAVLFFHDLEEADEIFLINSVRKWRKAKWIGSSNKILSDKK